MFFAPFSIIKRAVSSRSPKHELFNPLSKSLAPRSIIILNGANDFYEGLLDACRGGNLKAVEILLEHVKPNNTKFFKESCKGGDLEITKLIFDSMKLNTKRINSFLIYAGKGGNLEIVKFLINKAENLPNYGQLLECVRETENSDILDFILDFTSNTSLYPKKNFGDFLKENCSVGNLESLEYMINTYGANYKINYYKLMSIAFKNNYFEILEFLKTKC